MGIRRTQSFSLIELLVVVAILSVLAAIVLPFIGKGSEKGRVTRAQAQVAAIKMAVTSFEREYKNNSGVMTKFKAEFGAGERATFNDLKDILRGNEEDVNIRKISFLRKGYC